MSEELMAKLGDLITDVVAVRPCTAPDKTLWTKAQVMHYLQIGETRLKELGMEGFPGPRIRAKIDDLTFHDSRHDAITRLAQKLSVLQLARMVGHRDIRSLQTYYNETAESMARLL